MAETGATWELEIVDCGAPSPVRRFGAARTIMAGGAATVAHLLVCLEGRPIPDFLAARGGTI